MITDPVFYALAVPAVVTMGLAKGGFAGVGQIAMPLLALAISPVQAAAILLPILIVQDAVGVWAFRKTWSPSILMVLLPAAAVGIGLGWLLAAQVSATVVLGVLGAISILFAAWRLWLGRRGAAAALKTAQASAGGPHDRATDIALGLAAGVASGFTSQIAHAGQPPFHMWVLPKGLSPASLIGTTAIYFAVVNWLKVPAYLALGQFTTENLATAAVLLPVAIASTFAGVWLVKRIAPERFYTLIYVLMIAVGASLLWKAVGG